MASLGLAYADGEHGRGWRAAFGESLEYQPGVEKGVQKLGQGAVHGAHFVADPLVGP